MKKMPLVLWATVPCPVQLPFPNLNMLPVILLLSPSWRYARCLLMLVTETKEGEPPEVRPPRGGASRGSGVLLLPAPRRAQGRLQLGPGTGWGGAPETPAGTCRFGITVLVKQELARQRRSAAAGPSQHHPEVRARGRLSSRRAQHTPRSETQKGALPSDLGGTSSLKAWGLGERCSTGAAARTPGRRLHQEGRAPDRCGLGHPRPGLPSEALLQMRVRELSLTLGEARAEAVTCKVSPGRQSGSSQEDVAGSGGGRGVLFTEQRIR